MPPPILKYAQQFDQLKTYLTGEFDRVIYADAIPGSVVHEDLGIVLPPKSITELDRMAYLVQKIERDCAVVPKQSFKFTPLHEVRKNKAYSGLSLEELFDLKSWKHFRPIEQKEKKDILQREEAFYNDEFLDDIHTDLP
mmetsp:Transcript_3976/g.2938  ORF Transcript_3976/g.2938 Transcript_3976/m.2938 type:complete len:139 (+) Transcript_3976:270-686(+)